ncbi:MAG TPA: hypothetical protein VKG43_14040 [Acidimicrobiales bacterium]|nr:hypothetical protein [Acidimicrobiales bacterium]
MDHGHNHEGDDGEHHGEAVDVGAGEVLKPGDIIVGAGESIFPQPIVGSAESTRLEEDEPEGVIPPGVLWAMKLHRHTQIFEHHHQRIRQAIGTGETVVYVMDDGPHHCAIGRLVGESPDSCQYALVGRIDHHRYQELEAGRVAPADAFDEASELVLCGTAIEEGILSSNLFDVTFYEDADDVPLEFLSGPYRHFPADLEIDAD